MAFQQGLSGLSAASRNLDVIGNNIANANTVGMKSSRAEFADVYAAAAGTSSGAGLGVSVAAVSQQFTQGNISVTGNNLDVAINGGGFFELKQPNGATSYTRAGNFKLDKLGNLVTNDGAKVMGAMMKDGVLQPGPLVLPSGTPLKANPTTTVNATFNLPAQESDAAIKPTPRSTYSTSINVYDSQGLPQSASLYFMKTANPNEWGIYTSLDETEQPTGSPLGTLTFDANGKVVSGDKLNLNIPTSNPNSPEPGPEIENIAFDFGDATQFGGKFGVTKLQQNGYAAGELTSFNIASDGKLMASYSNGVTQQEGLITLVNFSNPQGLAPGGGNMWTATSDSGPALGPYEPGFSNLGLLRSGALEDSNVDLTSELVNMMVAQRAYQANAQTIKTQDQVLSTLLNMR